jgi:hypothetical protein
VVCGKVTHKTYYTIRALLIGAYNIGHKVDTATLGRTLGGITGLRCLHRCITHNNTTNGNLLSKEDADECYDCYD